MQVNLTENDIREAIVWYLRDARKLIVQGHVTIEYTPGDAVWEESASFSASVEAEPLPKIEETTSPYAPP
jgi:hypothetical protein